MKILLVDDDPDKLKLLQSVLKDAGFTVLTAESGRDALKIMDEIKPDFLLTDFSMPKLDGYQLMAEAKNKHKDLPGLIYTSMDAPTDLIKLAKDKLGVDLVGGYSVKNILAVVMQRFNSAFDENQKVINQLK